MQSTRVDTPVVEEKKPSSLGHTTAVAFLATGAAHPFRVMLNAAAANREPNVINIQALTLFKQIQYDVKSTVKYAALRVHRGIPENLLRGTAAASAQMFVKNHAQQYGGLGAGLLASTMMGAFVATFVETGFIRKTNRPAAMMNSYSLLRVNRYLLGLYILRECFFSIGVLTKKDLSPGAQNAVLVATIPFTAMTQKLVTPEATRDFLPKNIVAPDLRDGFGKTIRAMANGNVYTHPAFQAHFKNPTTMLAKIGNFGMVACGVNMVIFRGIYMFMYREFLDVSDKNMPTISASCHSLFSKLHARSSADASPTNSKEVTSVVQNKR